ncbi:MAG: rRNA maturation RNase YbeY [bacterium]|nr:rRNA maturation RNase YbeY [bacterium]
MIVTITFNNIKKVVSLNKTKTKLWLMSVSMSHKAEIKELSFNFCSDEYILEMNKEHLNHDYYTDIITFDMGEPGGAIEGDIYISIDRVKENAKLNNTKYDMELNRVMAHGLLHLIGFQDKTIDQQKEMRLAEDGALKLLIA